jgi:hypothetical protein
MTLLQHLNIEIKRLELEIVYGNSNNRGNLPSSILNEYRKKVEIYKNTVNQLNKISPLPPSDTPMDQQLHKNQLDT